MIEKIINLANDALYSYILIILLLLGGLYFTVRTLKDYEAKLKAGGAITFSSKEIDLPHETDYWN